MNTCDYIQRSLRRWVAASSLCCLAMAISAESAVACIWIRKLVFVVVNMWRHANEFQIFSEDGQHVLAFLEASPKMMALCGLVWPWVSSSVLPSYIYMFTGELYVDNLKRLHLWLIPWDHCSACRGVTRKTSKFHLRLSPETRRYRLALHGYPSLRMGHANLLRIVGMIGWLESPGSNSSLAMIFDRWMMIDSWWLMSDDWW